MITALAIGGLGTTAIAIVAIVMLAWKLGDAVTSERASLAAEVLAERAQNAAVLQRDAALAAQKDAEAERDDANKQLAAANARLAELAAAVQKEQKNAIDAASGDDLVALSHSVLGAQPVPAGGAAAPEDHHGGTDPVQHPTGSSGR